MAAPVPLLVALVTAGPAVAVGSGETDGNSGDMYQPWIPAYEAAGGNGGRTRLSRPTGRTTAPTAASSIVPSAAIAALAASEVPEPHVVGAPEHVEHRLPTLTEAPVASTSPSKGLVLQTSAVLALALIFWLAKHRARS